MGNINFTNLLGKTFTKVLIKEDNSCITFFTENNVYACFHDQDCCECVSINDICGDVNDLIGEEIILAEETQSTMHEPRADVNYEYYSYTWTFYRLATINGYVTIRWWGASNGCYSERVDTYEYSIEEYTNKEKL